MDGPRVDGRALVVLADILKDPELTKKANDVSRLSPAVADEPYSAAITAASDAINKLFPRPAPPPAVAP